jgi:hypothetical protein
MEIIDNLIIDSDELRIMWSQCWYMCCYQIIFGIYIIYSLTCCIRRLINLSLLSLGFLGLGLNPMFEIKYSLFGHEKGISCVKYSLDGKYLACSGIFISF